MEGIEAGAQPPAAFTGSSYEQDLPRLPTSWPDALLAFQSSDFVERTFGTAFLRAFVAAKKQEIDTFAEAVSAFEIATYRGEVGAESLAAGAFDGVSADGFIGIA